MPSVVNYSFDESGVEMIKQWAFGTDWPTVYIAYDDTAAYVGETLDAVRRTKQHLQEEGFPKFKSICLISNMSFNKSVILDLESFLIKYMSADGTRMLTNCNSGVVDHDYFYKKAYRDEFKDIWQVLIDMGIVQKSIIDIENSELFKYSPYKSLSSEQQSAAYEILRSINEINNATKQSIIKVLGGAGTGKTILAVYLVKLLTDIRDKKDIWSNVEDSEEAFYLQKYSNDIRSISNIGFVVPMVALRTTMKEVFRSTEGLDESMVLAPEEVVKRTYDILIVDEAHRLYQRKKLLGPHLYNKFDAINRGLMNEEDFSRSEKDLTELDWIIKSSRIQVLFYDELQKIRETDIGESRFEEICKPRLYKTFELFSQMRCKGGTGYYEYVRKVIEERHLDYRSYREIDGYELKVFDNITELFSAIQEKNESDNLCRIVAGPGWNKDATIVIDGGEYHWADKKTMKGNRVIYSIHKIQGFDLNYAGVVFGKEVYYDREEECIAVKREELGDNFVKCKTDEETRRFIINIYITLMTRGINGTFVYAVDPGLREYLHGFFDSRVRSEILELHDYEKRTLAQ